MVTSWPTTPPAMVSRNLPLRLLDTRTAGFVPPGYPPGQPLQGPGTINLRVACRPSWCPVGGVPEGATAVLLNVTSTQASDVRSYVTVWPKGQTRPPTSNLNLEPGVNVPNLVAVALGDDGDVSLYTNIGSTHLIADVVGYYSPASPNVFVGIAPSRRLDTRTALVPPGYPVGQPLTGPGAITLHVGGVGEVAPDATAVVANVTSTQATDVRSYVTVWPTGGSPPLASNLNLEPGVNVPNLVTTALNHDGNISLYTNIGQTHLITDIVGYYVDPRPDPGGSTRWSGASGSTTPEREGRGWERKSPSDTNCRPAGAASPPAPDFETGHDS